eukprot:2798457-Rhodomonas_salina.1
MSVFVWSTWTAPPPRPCAVLLSQDEAHRCRSPPLTLIAPPAMRATLRSKCVPPTLNIPACILTAPPEPAELDWNSALETLSCPPSQLMAPPSCTELQPIQRELRTEMEAGVVRRRSLDSRARTAPPGPLDEHRVKVDEDKLSSPLVLIAPPPFLLLEFSKVVL